MVSSTEREAVVAAIEEHQRRNVILTLNGMGSTTEEEIDPFCRQFVDDASSSKGRWSMDIGCAYGVHTLAALGRGARVIAVDLEPRHLALLSGMLPTSMSERLRVCAGRFPDIEMPVEETLGAILAARVLHFWDGRTIERMVARMFELLAPGGRAYALALTPYVEQLMRFQVVYQARRARGDLWPGLVEDLSLYDAENVRTGRLPRLMHFLDPVVLRRVFEQAGFVVETAQFMSLKAADWTRLQARPWVGVVARKPDGAC